MADTLEIAPGCVYRPGFLDRAAQADLVAALKGVAAAAPFYTPRMPRTGKPFSVEMTNCGPLGWVADKEGGYRYQATHPETGAPWPPIPRMLLDAWDRLSGYAYPPEAGLINYYRPNAKMGLHRDEDEADFTAPVVSLSLGDTAIFRVGGPERRGPTRSVKLSSGDAIVLGGQSRLAYHGIDRILAGTSTLLVDWLRDGGRINVTLRRVAPPGA